MKYLSLSSVLFCALLSSSSAFAKADISYEGTSRHEIVKNTVHDKLNRAVGKIKAMNALSKKSVTVLNVKLTTSFKKSIQTKLMAAVKFKHAFKNIFPLPAQIQLGMNNVPVLDQGVHGTCATFAIIGAFDALVGQGDYYSELCSLSLGQTLEQSGYSSSGWEGQSGNGILARIDEFGLVSKYQEQITGCGGVNQYPVTEATESLAMSLEDFHSISTPSYYSGFVQSSSILDLTKWLYKDMSANELLTKVKKSLYSGDRLMIGTLLPMQSDLGASGSYQTQNDTWLLTGELEEAVNMMLFEEESSWGGHAMIITGYDDDAVVMDAKGNPHKGIFTLRNSWGPDAGDKGNYYMSYDYLAVLAIELTEIVGRRSTK